MEDVTIAFRCPVKLADKVDAYIQNGEYMNRGDAGRDLLRLGMQMKEIERNEKKQTLANNICFPTN
jgi:Arc/MetJ-type ribon-helix-helix transcriptional regulator